MAERLRHYIHQMTGKELTITVSRDLPRSSGNVFVLDLNGNHRGALLAGSVRQELPPNPDAFFIRSVEHDGRHVVVISARGYTGLGYGVFDYLQRYCRVGFFVDGVHVPRLSGLPMSGLDFLGIPAFEIRGGAGAPLMVAGKKRLI